MLSSRTPPSSLQMKVYWACTVERGATGDELAHVAGIENAHAGADGPVLLDDAFVVLDGHHPAAELDHASAQVYLLVVERSAGRLGPARHFGVTAHIAVFGCPVRTNSLVLHLGP